MNLTQILPLIIGGACLLLLSAQCKPQSSPTTSPVTATSAPTPAAGGLPYDLTSPSQTISLATDDLKEISALSPTNDPDLFLAVADERGEIFFVNVKQNGAVTNRVFFKEKGDFEGVEMVGDYIYCLKSNGVIFEISDWKNGQPKVKEYPTPLKKENDLEGLGYDPVRKSLLLACKENPESDVARRIFAFDLTTHKLSAEPVYTINPGDVNALVPYNDEEKKQNSFSSSGVAVHPLTNDIYVVSTSLKRLAVLDHQTGKIRFAARLEKIFLPQPEGISFDPEGNLYISSEGKKGEGAILKFAYRG